MTRIKGRCGEENSSLPWVPEDRGFMQQWIRRNVIRNTFQVSDHDTIKPSTLLLHRSLSFSVSRFTPLFYCLFLSLCFPFSPSLTIYFSLSLSLLCFSVFPCLFFILRSLFVPIQFLPVSVSVSFSLYISLPRRPPLYGSWLHQFVCLTHVSDPVILHYSKSKNYSNHGLDLHRSKYLLEQYLKPGSWNRGEDSV